MTASTKPTIVEALAAVMADVQGVAKSSRNESQGFNFRGIDAVTNAVGPALRAHGVIVAPNVEEAHYATVTVGQRGTPMRECTLRIRFTFHGPAGDTLDTVVQAEALDSGDKATSKAHSVALRTCLLQTLCIPTDEPDPDSVSYERTTPQPAVPPLPAGWESWDALGAVWDELRAATEALSGDQQANVKAGLGNLKFTKNTFTPEHAELWRALVAAAVEEPM